MKRCLPLSLLFLAGCAIHRPSLTASLGTPDGFLSTGTISGASGIRLLDDKAMIDLAGSCETAALCIGTKDSDVTISGITLTQYIQKSGRKLIVVEPSKRKRWRL
jgi:hypothetical protein